MSAAIGETLRQARLDAGLELGQVEERTKIRLRYLRALEAEDFDALPGDAYVRGFLRTYADFLGLDGAELVDEYRRGAPGPAPEQPAEPLLERPRRQDGREVRISGRALVGVAIAGVLAVLLILGLTGGSSDHGGRKGSPAGHREASRSTSTTQTTTPQPAEVSVSLAPTGTVWVCLVDQSGKPLVNGETLTAGDDRGPFRAGELKLTLGNGAIQMEVNGKPFRVPAAAEPLGYDLTPSGVQQLDPSARPTCT